ncbi:MAG: ABC transporter ATP-binding protein [Sphaerochaetaceae bacterium]|nr:ABC transporter ATP-binding protein [Sphaerochaetaceae bacterium]
MDNEFLKLVKLNKTFGNGSQKVTAVNDIDLDVREGELVTLLGPSGCGKTTTLRMIAGFQTPTSGHVYIDRAEMENIPPNKRPTSMVFQNYALFPHMSVRQNISYGLEIRHLSKSEINERVDKTMESIGLTGLGDRQPRELSGGQQQRVSLARAMILEPKVLLFDEPLSNLDAKLKVSTRLEIRRIQQRVGITSVYVTHDQEEAMTISDRIVVMKNGVIQQVASPVEIYSHPRNRFVAGFIGKANFMRGNITEINGDSMMVKTLSKVVKAPYWNKDLKVGQDVIIVVRPESIVVHEADEDSEGLLDGKVIHAVYFGSQIIYEIELKDKSVMNVEISDPQDNIKFQDGSDVKISLKYKSLHVLPFEEKVDNE